VRNVFAVFALGLLLGSIAVFLDHDSTKAPPFESAVKAAAVNAETDCDDCQTPVATATPPPCPQCNQSETRWQSLSDKPPPELLGTSAALLEGSCARMIYGFHSGERREPASLAKIVTAMVVMENADLDDVVDITVNGWDLVVENNSSVMGLEAGMRLPVEELLYGLLLPSGNDAALALADELGGVTKTVDLMNQRIRRTGLKDTVLKNPHGLDDPGAHTTPFDMAILGRELLSYPELATIVGTEFRPEPWHDNGGIWNGNYLMYVYDDAIGIKTGYTEEAGWSIVSAARRDGRLLIASVFNSSDPYLDSMRLFDWAYDNVKSPC
jgi:D-alanyl-D-alanine carboxypeptidase